MNRALLESLAKYQIGDTVHRVSLVPSVPRPEIGPEDDWKIDCHPKVLYTAGIRPWKCSQGLPRVGDLDFVNMMAILTSKVVVRSFRIEEIERSNHTGEMLYRYQQEWLPEGNLMETRQIAQVEADRIIRLVRLWTINEL